jgi:hypothetical protein
MELSWKTNFGHLWHTIDWLMMSQTAKGNKMSKKDKADG